jgi:hypothetical protein
LKKVKADLFDHIKSKILHAQKNVNKTKIIFFNQLDPILIYSSSNSIKESTTYDTTRITYVDTTSMSSTATTSKTTQEKPNVNIFDLNAPLVPENIYASINCKNSASFYNISTTLCLHNLENDVYVSGSISANGVWEREIMSNKLFIKNSKIFPQLNIKK